MKRIVLCFALIGMSFIAIGCAGDDSHFETLPDMQPTPGPQPGPAPAPTLKQSYRIHGEEPAEFFKFFQFGHTGSCSDQSLWYRKAGSERISLGKDELGRDIVGKLDVMLLAGGSYYAVYEEVSIIRYTRYGYESTSGVKKEIRAKWSVVRDKLVLEGLGVASGLKYNDRKAMQLVFDRDLITGGLVGSSTLLVMMLSNNAGVSELEVCKR